MRLKLLGLALLVLVAPAPASARKLCTEGRFLASAPLIIGDGAIVLDGVELNGRQVAVADACGPVHARMRASRRGTIVKAVWTSCDGLPGRVRLRARVDRRCRKLAGVLRAPEADFAWSFRAARVAACGNGIREDDEACDDGNTDDGDCCSAACTREDSADCAGTACAANGECAAGSYCEHDGACEDTGTCRQRPEACVGLLEPVCGCDGHTYVNACEAGAAGVSVAARGRCDRRCGGIAGFPCADGEFCEFRPGTCRIVDNAGTCVDVPDACADVRRPVCGCDGQTYANDCERRAAGAQKAHDGACRCREIGCPPGSRPVDRDRDGCTDECLFLCRDACDCYENPAIPVPDPCPLDCATCDNYWVCEAGVCQNRCGPVPPGQGECQAPACKDNAECGAEEYCATPPGQCGGEGICQPRLVVCPAVVDPVCGCDGHTYSSVCDAAAAGVSVAHRGACRAECGTIAGLSCPPGEFCDFPPGTCNVVDNGGTCEPLSRACPEIFQPVCGCDGRTYGSDCERRNAGAQKAHDGPCECPPILCAPGTLPHDTDGDGCFDACLPAGCTDNAQCGRGSYCAARPGHCRDPGVCAPRPGACTRIYAPVCGCDGQTYPNPCVAAASGVRVAAEGPCACPAILCAPGTVAVDRDGDRCAETCVPGCATACECDGLAVDDTRCLALCPTCGPSWICLGGTCVERCGPTPPDRGCSLPVSR